MKISVRTCSIALALFCAVPQIASALPEPARAELRAKYNLSDGKRVYENVCATCHASGIMEAPAFCDISAWKPRIEKGMEVLVKHATEGFNNMPKKGGMENLTVAESANAVAYMVDQCLTH